MDTLIDPQTTPHSSKAEIEAEIAELEQLPASEERDRVISDMRDWLRWKAEASRAVH